MGRARLDPNKNGVVMSKKLWGGRFDNEQIPEQLMDFTTSLNVDHILAEYDCKSSIVQVKMLERAGYISKEEKMELIDVLTSLEEKIKNNQFSSCGYEDIHSSIQAYVEKECPVSGKKLHTARSRNEQVVNDMRLYCKDKILLTKQNIKSLQKSLINLGEKYVDVILPGYTHLNRAQPVLFSHLMLSYVEALGRDQQRLEDTFARCDVSVMGSGAIAGSALNIDRGFVCKELGFKKVSENSIDSVSDRDFIVEFVFDLSMVAVHLSRIAEDFILYSIPEFGFIDIGADFCTGSSLMPQKKNPDVLELIRGRSAKVISSLNSLLVLLKGLPHSYNRDLQEDKEPLFLAVDTVCSGLDILASLIENITVNKKCCEKALDYEFIYATDLAEYLVKRGVAFKEAHDIVGAIVKHCLLKKINISDLSEKDLKEFSPELNQDVYSLLNCEMSVKNKQTKGSTNPKFVKNELSNWKKKVSK